MSAAAPKICSDMMESAALPESHSDGPATVIAPTFDSDLRVTLASPVGFVEADSSAVEVVGSRQCDSAVETSQLIKEAMELEMRFSENLTGRGHGMSQDSDFDYQDVSDTKEDSLSSLQLSAECSFSHLHDVDEYLPQNTSITSARQATGSSCTVKPTDSTDNFAATESLPSNRRKKQTDLGSSRSTNVVIHITNLKHADGNSGTKTEQAGSSHAKYMPVSTVSTGVCWRSHRGSKAGDTRSDEQPRLHSENSVVQNLSQGTAGSEAQPWSIHRSKETNATLAFARRRQGGGGLQTILIDNPGKEAKQ